MNFRSYTASSRSLARGSCCWPGGFGTMDEAFGSSTLVQTARAAGADRPKNAGTVPGRTYWRRGGTSWKRSGRGATRLRRGSGPGARHRPTSTAAVEQGCSALRQYHSCASSRAAWSADAAPTRWAHVGGDQTPRSPTSWCARIEASQASPAEIRTAITPTLARLAFPVRPSQLARVRPSSTC